MGENIQTGTPNAVVRVANTELDFINSASQSIIEDLPQSRAKRNLEQLQKNTVQVDEKIVQPQRTEAVQEPQPQTNVNLQNVEKPSVDIDPEILKVVEKFGGNPNDDATIKMAKSYYNSTKKMGQMGNEVGNLRKVLTQYSDRDFLQQKIDEQFGITKTENVSKAVTQPQPIGNVPAYNPVPNISTENFVNNEMESQDFLERLEENPRGVIFDLVKKATSNREEEITNKLTKKFETIISPLQQDFVSRNQSNMLSSLKTKYPDSERYEVRMAEILDENPTLVYQKNFLEAVYKQAKGEDVERLVKEQLSEKLKELNINIEQKKDLATTVESGNVGNTNYQQVDKPIEIDNFLEFLKLKK